MERSATMAGRAALNRRIGASGNKGKDGEWSSFEAGQYRIFLVKLFCL